MPRRTLAEAIEWVDSGTQWALEQVTVIPDAAFHLPSALPGWTRAHIVAHLARNAEALERLLNWARTGTETPMYSSPEQRAAEIETGRLEAPATLRRNLAAASASLSQMIGEFPASSWSSEVRSATGRTIPASEIPWLRTREVWLHTVDLDIGAQLSELPPAVVLSLIDDIVGSFASREGIAALRIEVEADDQTSEPDSWSIGESARPRISGSAVQVLAWLSGRSSGRDLKVAGTLPVLPAWL